MHPMIAPATTKALDHHARQIANCDRKIAFESMGHAVRYTTHLPFRNRPYRCGICGLWHLTSKAAR